MSIKLAVAPEFTGDVATLLSERDVVYDVDVFKEQTRKDHRDHADEAWGSLQWADNLRWLQIYRWAPWRDGFQCRVRVDDVAIRKIEGDDERPDAFVLVPTLRSCWVGFEMDEADLILYLAGPGNAVDAARSRIGALFDGMVTRPPRLRSNAIPLVLSPEELWQIFHGDSGDEKDLVKVYVSDVGGGRSVQFEGVGLADDEIYDDRLKDLDKEALGWTSPSMTGTLDKEAVEAGQVAIVAFARSGSITCEPFHTQRLVDFIQNQVLPVVRKINGGPLLPSR